MELWFHLPIRLAVVAGEEVMSDQVKKLWLLTFVTSIVFLASMIAAAAQAVPATTGSSSVSNAANSSDPGEKIFAANCARCHIPPMTLNQRITGTVVMHMRTRARLSRKDQEVLLRYLAP